MENGGPQQSKLPARVVGIETPSVSLRTARFQKRRRSRGDAIHCEPSATNHLRPKEMTRCLKSRGSTYSPQEAFRGSPSDGQRRAVFISSKSRQARCPGSCSIWSPRGPACRHFVFLDRGLVPGRWASRRAGHLARRYPAEESGETPDSAGEDAHPTRNQMTAAQR